MQQTVIDLVNGLMSKDNEHAYACLKELQALSARSNDVYPFFDTFASMLESSNSYIRTRGAFLIAANAKWDEENKLDEIISRFLMLIMDEKPITARQCIKLMPAVAKHKPELKDIIKNALYKTDTEKYKPSMQKLILGDIKDALEQIERPKEA